MCRCSLVLVTVLILGGTAFGQQEWVGVQVMPKPEFSLKERERVIPDSKLNTVPYVVQKQNGDWLLVGDRVLGWAHKSHVVKLPEAAAFYTAVLKKKPNDPLTLVRRAIAYTELGNADQAVADYTAALKLDPKNATALNNRGSVLAAKGEADKAIADFTESIKLDPKFALAFNNRGSLYAERKEYDLALADFDEAVRLDAEDGRFYFNRGSAREAKADFAGAIADYETSIKLKPNQARSYNNLAWIRATSADAALRNGAQAVELAEKAVNVTKERDPISLDTLAAAYAEAGAFDKAIAAATKALKITPAAGRPDSEKRLKLYQENKAYRQD